VRVAAAVGDLCCLWWTTAGFFGPITFLYEQNLKKKRRYLVLSLSVRNDVLSLSSLWVGATGLHLLIRHELCSLRVLGNHGSAQFTELTQPKHRAVDYRLDVPELAKALKALTAAVQMTIVLACIGSSFLRLLEVSAIIETKSAHLLSWLSREWDSSEFAEYVFTTNCCYCCVGTGTKS